jgi:hypothetical protein
MDCMMPNMSGFDATGMGKSGTLSPFNQNAAIHNSPSMTCSKPNLTAATLLLLTHQKQALLSDDATRTLKDFQTVCYTLEAVLHKIFSKVNKQAQTTSG